MRREVQPEWLDTLPADDPRAIQSRADLRRLNRIMGHAAILSRAFLAYPPAGPRGVIQIVELGSGDGTLLLQLIRDWSCRGLRGHVTLVDREPAVADETRRGFEQAGYSADVLCEDLMTWLERPGAACDLLLANLVLHHFKTDALRELLRRAALRTRLLLACEPRRSALALVAARGVGAIGCNAVTRHDAVLSVRAGFSSDELTQLWPSRAGWTLRESRAGWFSHCFVARKDE